MTTFVSKSVEIEARRWSGQPYGCGAFIASSETDRCADCLVAWVNANGGEARYETNYRPQSDKATGDWIMVRTNSGWAPVAPGWWVIKGSEWFETGEILDGGDVESIVMETVLDHYPCDPDTFAKRWEAKR